MTTAVQHRRGTTAEHSTFTGLEGEVTIDTTKDTAVIHDGALAGGYPLAKENLANANPTTLGSLDGASTASGDLFVVYDSSAGVMKKITRAELNNAMTTDALDTVDINGGTIDGTVIGGTIPAAVTGTTITGSSFVTTGDMTFGDNDKAIFGAGSDLQIYHDGSNSYVSETGTGFLILQGAAQVEIKSSAVDERMIIAKSQNAVELYYDNALKLATTSTGIDVTGTVVADGLTVGDGHTIGNDASDNLKIVSSSGENIIISTGDDFFVHAGSDTRRFKVDNTGDISFYEDTGTTPKFFWDASAESLGIGTTNPTKTLTVDGTTLIGVSGNNQLAAGGGDYSWIGSNRLRYNQSTGLFSRSSATEKASMVIFDTDANVKFYAQPSTSQSGSYSLNPTVTIDSSGNLGLGVTPSAWASGWAVIQPKGGSIGSNGNNSLYIGSNVYYDGSNWKYNVSDYSSRYAMLSGQHQWFVAGSGTAGATISYSQAMTLNASGNLGIGTSSPNEKLEVYGASAGVLRLSTAAKAFNIYTNNSDGTLYFRDVVASANRMALDSSGNIGLGVTPSAWKSNYTAIQVGERAALAGDAWTLLGNNTFYNSSDINTYIADGFASSYYQVSGEHQWFTAGSGTAGSTISFTQAMKLDASGNLGVGTTSPSARLDIVGTSGTEQLRIGNTTGGTDFGITVIENGNAVINSAEGATARGIQFQAGGTNTVLFDSSGNLLVGTTTAIEKLTVNGSIVSSGYVYPSADNNWSCGVSGKRWTVIYAATGTINTSDAREKTAVSALTSSEINAAKQIAAEIGSYKWLSAIEKKGDKARSHIGMTVQRAIEIMEANGLVSFNYGFICYDEWDEKTAEDGTQIQTAGNRYSFRMDELGMFIARGQQAAIQEQQAIIESLKARLDAANL